MEAAVAARLGNMERPPPWIDVTTALRFMVEDGRILLHPVRLLRTCLLPAKLSHNVKSPSVGMRVLYISLVLRPGEVYGSVLKAARGSSGSDASHALRRWPGRASWASAIQRLTRQSTCACTCYGTAGPTPPASLTRC